MLQTAITAQRSIELVAPSACRPRRLAGLLVTVIAGLSVVLAGAEYVKYRQAFVATSP
jgi:hypothetical protein